MLKKVLTVSLITFVLAIFLVILEWSNLFNVYSLPNIPGLTRLGAGLFFPKAILADFVNENTVLFKNVSYIDQYWYDIYQFQFNTIWPVEILKDYRFWDLKLSSDNNEIIFTGWGPTNNHVWLSKGYKQPVPIEDQDLSTFDVYYLDWSNDKRFIFVQYFEKPNKHFIGKLDLEQKNPIELFQLKDGEYPLDGISVADEKIVYITRNSNQAISIFDVKENRTHILDLGNREFKNVRFMKTKPWLIAIQTNEYTSQNDQIVFINYEQECVVLPFQNLAGIGSYSLLEKNGFLKLALTDEGGKLYILDVNRALNLKDTSDLFNCHN